VTNAVLKGRSMRTGTTYVVLMLCSALAAGAPVNAGAQYPSPVGAVRDVPASADHVFLRDSSASRAAPWGTAIGAVAGGILGYFWERGYCDRLAPQCTGRHGAVGGAVLGALVGYGIGRLLSSDHGL
jgi:hypothetical protein